MYKKVTASKEGVPTWCTLLFSWDFSLGLFLWFFLFVKTVIIAYCLLVPTKFEGSISFFVRIIDTNLLFHNKLNSVLNRMLFSSITPNLFRKYCFYQQFSNLAVIKTIFLHYFWDYSQGMSIFLYFCKK